MEFGMGRIMAECLMIRLKVFLVVIVALSTCPAFAAPLWQEGDLIFQTSESSQSLAVQKATRSPYSHMGVLLKTKTGLCVFEAITTVQCTPINKWILRGKNERYVLKRLKSSPLASSPEAVVRFRKVAQSFSGLPYDLTFEWSDARIYCSELVWKIYQRAFGISIGELSKLRDFDLTSGAVRKKLEERYKGNPPLDEEVISPDAMFRSPLLLEVETK